MMGVLAYARMCHQARTRERAQLLMRLERGVVPKRGSSTVRHAARAGVDPPLVGKANYGSFVDSKTEELRAAHDVFAEFYAERLADALDHMPIERAVLSLFCELTLAAELGTSVGDVGCGTGRLEPYLAAKGLSPRGSTFHPR